MKRAFYIFKKIISSKIFISLILLCFVVGVGAMGYAFYKVKDDIPDVLELKNYSPSLITYVYDRNGDKLAEFYVERRILRPLEEIPEMMKLATLAIEDDNFYNHNGVDPWGILRAAIVNLKAGHIVQGGSTITQQVAKLIFLTPERSFKRKFRELILSLQIEKHFSKSEILEIYLNQIYYGHGAYGVEAAARTYFDKHVDELTLSEMALLAGIPKAPSYFSPHKNPEAAVRRRDTVVKRMEDLGFITDMEATNARTATLRLSPLDDVVNHAPYFAEHVRRYIADKYGTGKLYHAGLKIYTTVDMKLQEQAQKALRKGIEVTDRRLGYRGAAGWTDLEKGGPDWEELNPDLAGASQEEWFKPDTRYKGVVKEVTEDRIVFEINGLEKAITQSGFAWAHEVDPARDGRFMPEVKDATTIGLKKGDVIEVLALEDQMTGGLKFFLDQYPEVQGAIMAVEYGTGAIRSMVGGYDFKKSKFNRAIQAKRQVGSSFKPIIYSAALSKDITPASIIIDAPIIYEDDIGNFKNWKPVNFNEKFFGPTTIRSAVTHSRNIVTIKTLEHIGIPYVLDWARRLGIESDLQDNLSLALGSSSISLQEMVSVYGLFPNGGVRNEPYFIERIEDQSGTVLEEHQPNPRRVMPPEVAYMTGSIMQSVVQEGTGVSVRGIGLPAGGKTGTTNDFLDAWFMGFTPGLACGVWIGKDREETLGKNETGSRAAAPIWLDYMKTAAFTMPKRPYKAPKDVVFVKVDKQSGALATPDNPRGFFEIFKEGTQPDSYLPPEPVS